MTDNPIDRLRKILPTLAEKELSGSDVLGEDELVKDEKQVLEDASIEARQKNLDLQSQSQDIAERKKYALWLYVLIVGWLISVMLAVFLGQLCHISDSVLIALITGLSVNVTGLFVLVVRYLFYRPS